MDAQQQDAFPTADADLAAMLERTGELMDAIHRWPKALADLTDVLHAHFTAKGMDKAQARDMSAEVVMVISHYMGGRQFYLPGDERLAQALKENDIWREFTGSNVHELAERYDLTIHRIYQIVAEQRKLHRKKSQMELL